MLQKLSHIITDMTHYTTLHIIVNFLDSYRQFSVDRNHRGGVGNFTNLSRVYKHSNAHLIL